MSPHTWSISQGLHGSLEKSQMHPHPTSTCLEPSLLPHRDAKPQRLGEDAAAASSF